MKKSMSRLVLDHIIVGLGIGFVVVTVSFWLCGAYEMGGLELMRQMTAWLVASALYGLVSLIYDSGIAFPAVLAIHFIGCTTVTLVASYASGIMTYLNWHFVDWCTHILPSFVIVYIIISVLVTLVDKCETKKINQKINAKNK